VTQAENVVVDSRDETREGGDAMRLSEEDADRAEATFRDRDLGVYADGAAQREIITLTGGVRALSVETEGEAGDQVDESTNCLLYTRDTEDSSKEREG
jgi:hypothetical protein